MAKIHRDLLLGVVGELVLLAVLTRASGLGTLGWLVGLGCGLLVHGLVLRAFVRSGAPALGPADRVTLTRAVLVVGVAALAAHGAGGARTVPVLVSLATAALILDGVDGWVARRTRTASARGGRFDLEVDAFLVLVLSLHVAGSVNVWVLAIGGARYLFVAAGWLLPWMRAALPFRYWRKVVAVVQGVALTLAASQLLPEPVVAVVLVLAVALLGESFGRDVWWLRRQSRSGPGPTHSRTAAPPADSAATPRAARDADLGP